MSSSCSQRMRTMGTEGILKYNFESPIRFLCLRTDSIHNLGCLKVVHSFAKYYGDRIPGTVYLHLPSGAKWFGTYVHGLKVIDGLQNFIRFYNIKPYTVVVLEYLGFCDFRVEIYNYYAVEIDYGLKDITFSNGVCSHNHLGLPIDDISDLDEIETDKHWMTLSYNAKSTGSSYHEILITNKHLHEADLYEVLSEEGCLKLELNSTIKWIHLGFKKHLWNINLKWNNGAAYFDMEWIFFAKSIGLCVGDSCLFLKTCHPQKFQLAIFEKETVGKYYRAGCSSTKGLLKFYKVMTYESVQSGELEVPRVFVKEFGDVKGAHITILVGDGSEFSAYISKRSNVMTGLKDMLRTYSIQQHFLLFFDYVGRSTFYVSMYNTLGMNICNQMEEKISIGELVKQFEVAGMTSKYYTRNATKGMIDIDVDNSAQHVNVEGRQISQEAGNFFTVKLQKCNVAQTGHGVYFARHVLPIYRTWKNGTILNVLCEGKTWRVAVHRKSKMCRFGRGWDQLAKFSKWEQGQKLKISHVSEKTFAVSIL